MFDHQAATPCYQETCIRLPGERYRLLQQEQPHTDTLNLR